MKTVKSLAEAKRYKYGEWAGLPDGHKYHPERCAQEVWQDHFHYQCQRKNGHGIDKLFCKQHSKEK